MRRQAEAGRIGAALALWHAARGRGVGVSLMATARLAVAAGPLQGQPLLEFVGSTQALPPRVLAVIASQRASGPAGMAAAGNIDALVRYGGAPVARAALIGLANGAGARSAGSMRAALSLHERAGGHDHLWKHCLACISQPRDVFELVSRSRAQVLVQTEAIVEALAEAYLALPPGGREQWHRSFPHPRDAPRGLVGEKLRDWVQETVSLASKEAAVDEFENLRPRHLPT